MANEITTQEIIDKEGILSTVGYFNSQNILGSRLKFNYLTLKNNQYYTIQFVVKASANTTILVYDKLFQVTNSWTKIEHTFIFNNTIKDFELVFGIGEFWFYNWQLEEGTFATTPTPSINDTNSKIEGVESIATQTADKFSWIVKSGTSASNMTLTDNMYNVISKNITLTADKITLGNSNEKLFEVVDGNVYAKNLIVGIDDTVIYFGDKSWTNTSINNTYFKIGYSSTWTNSQKITVKKGDILYFRVTNSTNGQKGILYLLCTENNNPNDLVEATVIGFDLPSKPVTNIKQIYFASAKNYVPDYPTSEITTTDTSVNKWTTVIPSVSLDYPDLYTCQQRTYSDGQVGWTKIILNKDSNSSATIQSNNYLFSTGRYSSQGLQIDFTNSKITSPFFSLDDTGIYVKASDFFINDITGNKTVAKFGSEIILGDVTDNTIPYVKISQSGLNIFEPRGTIPLFSVGYGSVKNKDGIDSVSFSATIGTRKSDSSVGQYSFACGNYNTASSFNSFACGNYNTASGVDSFACGNHNTASDSSSFVCGDYNTASGVGSFACGVNNTASGFNSFACGFETIAKELSSFACGFYTVADLPYLMAIGKYNETSSNMLFVIGNGEKDKRSNAFEVYTTGDTIINGTANAEKLILNNIVSDFGLVNGNAYIRALHTGGKTNASDKIAGTSILNNGTIGLCSNGNPAINFYYANSTSVTSKIEGNSNGVGIQGNLSVVGNMLVTKDLDLNNGSLTVSNSISVGEVNGTTVGAIFAENSVFTGGKTSYNDGKAGVDIRYNGSIYMCSNSQPSIYFCPSNTTSASVNLTAYSDGRLNVGTGKLTVYTGSTVDIGSHRLYVGGSARATSWNTTSDKRLKHNISDAYYNSIKDFYMDLNVKTFAYNEDETDKLHYGFIAQEVEELMLSHNFDIDKFGFLEKPNSENGYYGINYTDFIPMTIMVTQDHEKRINELEKELAVLRKLVKK